jgi:peptidyl-prolyl cis-trans isomerase D
MLASFRKLSNNFFTKILLLLVVASFALWGVSDMVGQNQKYEVAKVGNLSISADDYYLQLQKLRANMGEFFSPELLKKLNLMELSLQELIAKKLYALEAESMNLEISEDLLKKNIAKDEAFHNENKVFDAAIFQRRLQQMRLSENKLIEEIKIMAAQELLQKTVITEANFPEKYYEILFEAEFQRRKIISLQITDEQVRDISPADEGEIKGYYETNIARYNAPEYRDFDYILIDKQAIENSINITEEELKQAYLERQKNLMTPEKRSIWQLLYDDKAKAEHAYAMLRAGAKMAEVAKQVPPVNKDNLSLGMLAKHQFDFNAPDVFEIKQYDFTSPIKTDFGWHIFQVRKIKKSFIPAFVELRELLQTELRQSRKHKKLQELLENLEDNLAADLPLAQIATEQGLELQQAGQVDINGKLIDNTVKFAPEQFQPLLEAGFKLDKGKTSEIIKLNNDNYVLLALKEIIAARTRVLDEVRGLVTSDLQQAKYKSAKLVLAERISAALVEQKPTSFAQIENILTQNGIEDFNLSIIMRDGTVDNNTSDFAISSELLQQLFKAKQPLTDLYYSENMSKLECAIYLEAIKADKEKDAKSYQELKQRVQKHYSQEIIGQYLNSLQSGYPVIVDAKMIEAVRAKF